TFAKSITHRTTAIGQLTFGVQRPRSYECPTVRSMERPQLSNCGIAGGHRPPLQMEPFVGKNYAGHPTLGMNLQVRYSPRAGQPKKCLDFLTSSEQQSLFLTAL